jgi:Zn-dependent protease
MFIPGVGAFVRLDQHPETPQQDARVGLAGPYFGLGAALACYGLFLLTGAGLLAALAQVGAWINLFNLVPIWQLDGGRAFAGMTRSERGIAVAVLAGALLVSQEKLLILLLLGAVFRWLAPSDAVGDRWGLAQYAILVVALTALTAVGAPIP